MVRSFLAADKPLTVSGDYQQLANATTKPALGANGAGTLVVEGKAALAGDLAVTLVDGYAPTPGTKIEILKAGAVTGTFGKFTRLRPQGEPLLQPDIRHLDDRRIISEIRQGIPAARDALPLSACPFDPRAYVILRMCFRAAAPDSPLSNS